MSKQSGFMQRLALERAIREEQVRHHARIFQMDIVTLALGRLGWREKKFRELDEMMAQVAKEYSHEILSDSKVDDELWYSKDVLDREISQYVGSLFVPYDERYK